MLSGQRKEGAKREASSSSVVLVVQNLHLPAKCMAFGLTKIPEAVASPTNQPGEEFQRMAASPQKQDLHLILANPISFGALAKNNASFACK